MVTAAAPGAETDASDATRELTELLGGAQVELVRCDDLPNGPGGKFRHLVPLPRNGASAPIS